MLLVLQSLTILRCRSVLPQNVPLCYTNLKKRAGMLFKSHAVYPHAHQKIKICTDACPCPFSLSKYRSYRTLWRFAPEWCPKSQEYTDICPLSFSLFSCAIDYSVPFGELQRYDAQIPTNVLTRCIYLSKCTNICTVYCVCVLIVPYPFTTVPA